MFEGKNKLTTNAIDKIMKILNNALLCQTVVQYDRSSIKTVYEVLCNEAKGTIINLADDINDCIENDLEKHSLKKKLKKMSRKTVEYLIITARLIEILPHINNAFKSSEQDKVLMSRDQLYLELNWKILRPIKASILKGENFV